MGGILAGIRLTQAGLPFTIVDQNKGPGGTWWENRYPGARVDVGSHQYCFSFEPAEHWSEYYCQQPELCAYFGTIVEKFELLPHCRFETAVTEMAWHEDEAMWRVGVRDAHGAESTLPARFVVSAVGSLNLPRLPDIPGMDTFGGPSFHSARWPEDLDIGGTRFALVGAGASGFQIGPAIADEVEQLTIFQRTAQWILPNRLYHTPVPAGDAWALRYLPFYGRWYRFVMTFAGIAAGMEMYRIDPAHEDPTHQSINALNARRAKGLLASMQSIVGDDPELLARVVPDYPATGKRILQDDGTWLRTLQRSERGAGADGDRAGGAGRHRHDGRAALPGRRHLLRHGLPPQRVPGLHAGDRPQRRLAARPVGRGAHGVPRHHHAELPQPVLRLRAGDEPGLRRQPLLPRRIPGALRPGGHARDAGVRGAVGRGAARGPR